MSFLKNLDVLEDFNTIRLETDEAVVSSAFMTKSIKTFRHDRFNALLAERGIRDNSQTEIANIFEEATGERVHQTTISGLLSGKRGPSLEMLTQWASFFDVSTDYLLGLTDDEMPPGNKEEQVLWRIRDPKLRQTVQEVVEKMAEMSSEDVALIDGLIRRLTRKPNSKNGRTMRQNPAPQGSLAADEQEVEKWLCLVEKFVGTDASAELARQLRLKTSATDDCSSMT